MTLLESKRLKTSLKELEELLMEQPVIFSSWRSSSLFQIMLGMFSHYKALFIIPWTKRMQFYDS